MQCSAWAEVAQLFKCESGYSAWQIPSGSTGDVREDKRFASGVAGFRGGISRASVRPDSWPPPHPSPRRRRTLQPRKPAPANNDAPAAPPATTAVRSSSDFTFVSRASWSESTDDATTVVEVVEEGRSPSELAREFERSGQSITNWVAQAEVDDGRRGGLTTDEKAELRKLRAENRVLRMEKDLLEKAAAFFAAKNTPTR